MKIRAQQPPQAKPSSKPPAPATAPSEQNRVAQPPTGGRFRDELVQARKPLVDLNPGWSAPGNIRSHQNTGTGTTGTAPQQGPLFPPPEEWPGMPPAYPTTPEELERAMNRIGKALHEKNWGSEQQALLDFIQNDLNVSPIDIWYGSHVVVNDGGAFYAGILHQFESVTHDGLPVLEERESSHYAGVDAQQYEIDFDPLGTLLFGLDENGNTWFQMENHSGSTEFNLPGTAVALTEENPQFQDEEGHFDASAIFSDPVGSVVSFGNVVGDTLEHGATEAADLLQHNAVDYVTHELTGQNVGPLGLSPHSEKTGNQLQVEWPG